MTPPRVLVTDARLGSAIAVIRSLGRAGMHVIAADHERRSTGFRSRYSVERLVYPNPASDPLAVVELLRDRAAAGDLDLIVPVTDELMLPLAAARERFAGLCALAIPDDAALATAADKAATVRLAERLGVPVPQSVLVQNSEEALSAAPQLGWPVVLKPATSFQLRDGMGERFSVAYADGPEMLKARMDALAGRCSVLLQEYCAGEGSGVELLLENGRPLMTFQHRRLHEVPITGGASALRESVAHEPELVAHAVRLLGAMSWTGLAMVEFRVGARGPLLMEVNGRVWGSLPLAVRSGVDFPLGLAKVYLGRHLNGHVPTPPLTPASIGVRSRNLRLEVVWIASVLRRRRLYPFLAVPRRRDGIVAALRLPLPRDGFDLLSRDDPAPGVIDALRAAGHLLHKVRDAA